MTDTNVVSNVINIDLKANNDWSEIHKAAYFGNLENLISELNAGIDPNYSEKKLLSLGAFTSEWNPLSFNKRIKVYFENVTPLYLAAQKGHIKCVKVLMERGANPKIIAKNTFYKNAKGVTPKQIAIWFCNYRCYKTMTRTYSEDNFFTNLLRP